MSYATLPRRTTVTVAPAPAKCKFCRFFPFAIIPVLLLLMGGGGELRAAPIDQIISSARQLHLAQEPGWQRLLFFQQGLFGGRESFWDAPEDFLSPRGKYDAEQEMLATLRGFVAPATGHFAGDNHPLCRYPARFKWLEKRLPLGQLQLPVVTCKAYENYLSIVKARRVSLAFSSYYFNNPGLMFGHTLLKLHNSDDPQMIHNYRDSSISFAANIPPGTGVIPYALKGLSGGWDGIFQMWPYYMKVQEYSNHEVRDLWEYELDFTPEEVAMLIDTVWEVGRARADYYFLTENCAYILIYLLDVIRPTLNLQHALHYWVIPIDTVRVVADAGLVRAIRYEPSSYSRYQQRLALVRPADRPLVERLLAVHAETEVGPLLSGRPKEAQAALLDAAVEFIEYADRLAVDKPPVIYADSYSVLLASRADLRVASPPLTQIPANRPDMGHKSNLLAVSLAAAGRGDGYLDLRWRPAMHDQLSSFVGYSREMDLTVLEHEVRYEKSQRRFFLQNIEFLGVGFSPTFTLQKPAVSWESHIAVQQWGDTARGENRPVLHWLAGYGLTLRAAAGSVTFSLLPRIAAELPLTGERAGQVGAGGLVRFLFAPEGRWRLLAEGETLSTSRGQQRRAGRLAGAIDLAPQRELRLFIEKQPQSKMHAGIAFLQFL